MFAWCLWCWDGVTRLGCLCLARVLAFTGRESIDLVVTRRAKKMMCGATYMCMGVVCELACLLRFLSAFSEGVRGRLISFVLEVGF